MSDIRIRNGELIGARLENDPNPPSDVAPGRMYYNTTTGKMQLHNGVDWMNADGSDISPKHTITVGQEGCQFNLIESTTPITDAINSITPAADENNIWLIKIYPGVYEENIIVPEYVLLEGSGDSSVIKSTNGTAPISFNNTGNALCYINNIKVDALNSSAMTITNNNLFVKITNCIFNVSFDNGSLSDKNVIYLDSGTLHVYNSILELRDLYGSNGNNDYNSIYSLTGSDEIKINVYSSDHRIIAQSLNHYMVMLKSNNTEDNTDVLISSSNVEIINTTAMIDNVMSTTAIESANGIYKINSCSIRFITGALASNFLCFLGFIFASPAPIDTKLIMSNNIFDCEDIDEGKLYIDTAGSLHDHSIITNNTLITNHDFYVKQYPLFGTIGKINYDITTNYSRRISNQIKTVKVTGNWAGRSGNHSNLGNGDWKTYSNFFPVVRKGGNGHKYYLLNIPIPDDCNEIVSLDSSYIIDSTYVGGSGNSTTIEYDLEIAIKDEPSSNWHLSSVASFSTFPHTDDHINYHNLIGLIPNNIRETLAGGYIAARLFFRDNNFVAGFHHIGYELKYI